MAHVSVERVCGVDGHVAFEAGAHGVGLGSRTEFQEISERAGLGNIKSPFVNMRRSRSNDVVRRYGREMEKLWIGHTADVMEKYYLRLLEEDFAAEKAE